MQTFQKQKQDRNQTGIPDKMKAHFESAGGLPLDDVKVHYQSEKPAQLQALAYTQGSHVYVGPGQEKHLPHELVHVIQQKSGRVQATGTEKGMAVNDSPELEKEADSITIRGYSGPKAMSALPVQMKLLGNPTPTDAKSLIEQQFSIQDKRPEEVQEMVNSQHTDEGRNRYRYTTAGFEYEFLQMKETAGMGDAQKQFMKSIHAQFGKSDIEMGFTQLPFYLETDAANAVELVCPPYLVETRADYILPLTEDIGEINRMMKVGLQTVAKNSTDTTGIGTANISELQKQFSSVLGLNMDIKLEKDLSEDNFPVGGYDEAAPKTVSPEDLTGIGLKVSRKGLVKKGIKDEETVISPQMNFATNSATYLGLRKSPKTAKENRKHGAEMGKMYSAAHIYRGIMRRACDTERLRSLPCSKLMPLFLDEFADRLAQSALIPNLTVDGAGAVRGKKLPSTMLSHVKDISDIWLKDSLESIASGAFKNEDYIYLKTLCGIMKQNTRIIGVIKAVVEHVEEFCTNKQVERDKVEFMHHSMGRTGVRQDTYIDLLNQEGIIGSHVVEIRKHNIKAVLGVMHSDMEKILKEQAQTRGRRPQLPHTDRSGSVRQLPHTDRGLPTPETRMARRMETAAEDLPQIDEPEQNRERQEKEKQIITEIQRFLNAYDRKFGLERPEGSAERAGELITELERVAPGKYKSTLIADLKRVV